MPVGFSLAAPCHVWFPQAVKGNQKFMIKTNIITWHAPPFGSRRACLRMVNAQADTSDEDSGTVGADGLPLRYIPSADSGDPVADAVVHLTKGDYVKKLELLDSRWNGNEAFRYDVAGCGPEKQDESVFAKLNRVENPQIFMAEAIALTTLIHAAPSVVAPRPLHIGKLPRVGTYGPGAFMLLQWFDLVPFGASRSEVQRRLGSVLADIHKSPALEHIHKQRFGFTVNNFLGLTPMDNSWENDWPSFFGKRLMAQAEAVFRDKPYGRAPLDSNSGVDVALKSTISRIVSNIHKYFDGCTVTPSLLHGDLWIGNVSATQESVPVIYDPASFFGHSEFDLALMRMFGGFTDHFWNTYFDRVPKTRGFDIRSALYELYQYLNQLNLFGDPKVRDKVFNLAEELLNYID